MKNAARAKIAGVTTLASEAEVATLSVLVALLALGGGVAAIRRAPSMPIAPATNTAEATLAVAAMKYMVAGAMAPPRKPAKVCTEKACPMRLGSIWADRME